MSRRTRLRAPSGVLLVALTILASPSAAVAAITPTDDPQAIAGAIMAAPAQLTGATWHQRPLNIDSSATATSFGTQPAGSAFPSGGNSFAILSSGNARSADDADVSPEVSGAGWGADRGDSHDVSALRLDVNVPAKANCLSLDFSFLSEEFPDYVGEYNDAFIAELDTSDWTASGVAVSAPHNFAFDDNGHAATINAGGVAAVSLDAGDGTTYNAATARISASTPIAPGPHRIYLSISDNGDWALDSAAFVDNLQIGAVTNPSANCRPGARLAPPHFTQSGPRSATGREGSMLTTSGSFADAGAAPLMLSISPNPGRFEAHADGSWAWSLLATDDLQLGGITVSATSGFGFADSESFDAIATNVAPLVTLSPDNDTDVLESPAEHVVRYAISDPGADAIGSVVTSCGPGTKVAGSDQHTATEGSVRCVFADGPAAALVTVQATDDDGGVSELATQLVTVRNVAPAVALAAAQTQFDEGSAQRTFKYSISDPGRDKVASVSSGCGAGGAKVSGSSQNDDEGGSFACVFADGPATPTVTVAAADSDAADGAADTRSVVVRDVAPTLVLDASSPSSVDEGPGEVAFSYWTEDPGDDVVTVTSSCGEQGAKVAGSDAAGRFACVFADGNATSLVIATPVDSDDVAGPAGTREVAIHNVAPRVSLRGGERNVDEGAAERSFEYTVSDPGHDSFSAATACGDGGRKVAGSDIAGEAGGRLRCVFADGPATPAVSVVATDSDGATGPHDTREVTVENIAPTVTLDAANPLSVQESRGAHVYRYMISDPGIDTITSVTTSCGTGGVKDAGSDDHDDASGRLSCVFANGPKASEMSVKATDSDDRTGAARPQTVTVADPPIAAQAVAVQAVETAEISRTVARFSDPTPYATAGEYRATVDWGDGSAISAGTISKLDDGDFAVRGGHAYARFGTYDVSVRIADEDNPSNSDVVRATALVADAPIRAAGMPITTPLAVSGRVATFSDDADPDGPAADFTATVDWGDGSAPGTGTISGPDSGGRFGVSGSHTYAATGRYSVKVVVASTGGSRDSVTSPALVYAFATATGGSFAISDGAGTAVTFWSGQWQDANPFVSGTTAGSFKGYIEPPASMTARHCGESWSARNGGSASPPSTLPAYMAVVVTGPMDKSGSTVGGTIVRMVVVKTDSGSTGTVVGTVCG